MIINFDGYYIASLLFGVLAVLVCLLGYMFPKRTLTLFFKFLFDLFSFINLTLAYFATKEPLILAGLATNIVGMGRDILFMFRGKYTWADNMLWLFLILALYISASRWTYSSPLSLLPIWGSLINTTALYMTDNKRVRQATIIGQVIFITYYSLLIEGSELLTILNLTCSVMTLISVIVGLVVIYRKEKTKR